MPLVQLHWQWKTGKTEFIAQREITDHTSMEGFARDIKERHVQPMGAVLLVVLEGSEYFVGYRANPSFKQTGV